MVWRIALLAQELQSTNVSISELIPGPVATAITIPGDAQQLSGVGGSE